MNAPLIWWSSDDDTTLKIVFYNKASYFLYNTELQGSLLSSDMYSKTAKQISDRLFVITHAELNILNNVKFS